MAVSWLARQAPTAVFVLGRAWGLPRDVEIVSSPRHASVLLVAEDLPRETWQAARLVHDQVPAPRGVVAWTDAHPFPDAVRAERGALPAAHGEGTLLPEDNPVRWRGVGPHGQGGKGMMMGRPYGRSMAMTGEDLRDGLQLDRVSVTVGPFHRWLPMIELAVELQGDVVQSLALRAPPLVRPAVPEVFLRAEREPVPIRELELARARHHLWSVADLLGLLGLHALSERVARLAERPDADAVRRLPRRLGSALALSTRGVGCLEGPVGPAARAAGIAEDARIHDPSYEDFEPICRAAGDAEARWQVWLAEAARSLALARTDRVRAPGPPVEGPRGALRAEVDWQIPPGMAWDELLTTLVSLDLDPFTLPSEGFGAEQVRPAHALAVEEE